MNEFVKIMILDQCIHKNTNRAQKLIPHHEQTNIQQRKRIVA
jgi:hypothetical protein